MKAARQVSSVQTMKRPVILTGLYFFVEMEGAREKLEKLDIRIRDIRIRIREIRFDYVHVCIHANIFVKIGTSFRNSQSKELSVA